MTSNPKNNKKKRKASHKKYEERLPPSDNPPPQEPVDSGSPGGSPERPSSKRLRYVWIVASVVALGITLSPISPILPQQGIENSSLEEEPEPEETNESFLECGSFGRGVEFIIGGGFGELAAETLEEEGNEAFEEETDETFEEEAIDNATTTILLTEEQKASSDSLVGGICNRPELMRNMSTVYDPSISLVAYGCDAASGKIGDAALQTSLRPFEEIYCNSAAEAIQYETNSLIEEAQTFKTEDIPALKERIESEGNAGNKTSILQNIESIVDATIERANAAKESLIAGSKYDATKLLDEAHAMYDGMRQSEEMSSLFELVEEEAPTNSP